MHQTAVCRFDGYLSKTYSHQETLLIEVMNYRVCVQNIVYFFESRVFVCCAFARVLRVGFNIVCLLKNCVSKW